MIYQNENISRFRKGMESFILFFIVCQIVIDLLTTLSVKVLQFDVSFGMLARFAFLILVAVYVLFYGTVSSKIYGGILALFIGAQFLYVICSSDVSIFSNLRFYLRTVSFPLDLLLFYTFLRGQTEENRQKKIGQIIQMLNFFLFLMGVVFLISFLSGSYLPMYQPDDGRIGSQGWFLSGNEISSIMLVLSGIPIYLCYTEKHWKKQLFPAITLLLDLFTVASLGTKSSLFLLAVIPVMMVYSLIWTIVRKRVNIPFLVITLVSVLLLAVFWRQLPAVQNLNYQYELQTRINIEASQKENGTVEPSIQEKHDAAVWKDTGEYTGSVKLEMNSQSVTVFGYFYPYYVDMGHPNFVEKTLVLVDDENNRMEFPLADIYNRNIVNPEEDSYSSRFAGMSGEIPADVFEKNRQFSIFVKIKVDDFCREYDAKDLVSVTTNDFPYAVSYQDGVLQVGDKIDENGNNAEESNSSLVPYKYNLWFSARDNRLSNLLQSRQWGLRDLVVGTGYVANYADLNGGTGLEMDFIEIFITFGFVGFVLYFLLYFILMFKGTFLNLRKCWKAIISPSYLLFLLPLLLSAGSAFMAGHTFLTPSVAFHVSIVTAVFAFLNHQNKKGDVL